MKQEVIAKPAVRINVAINARVHVKALDYANSKGMKLNKVVEFAILDYLTKSQK